MQGYTATEHSDVNGQVEDLVAHVRYRARFRRIAATCWCLDSAAGPSATDTDAIALADDALDTSSPFPGATDHSSSALHALEALGDSSMTNKCEEITINTADVRLPPAGRAWARVTRNLALPEGWKNEFFVPYLGEADEDLDASSRLASSLAEDDPTVKATNKEIALQLFDKSPYSDVVLEVSIKEQADDSDAEDELYDHRDRTKECYAYGAWDRSFKREAVFYCISYFGPGLFSTVVQTLSAVLQISEEAVRRYFSNALFRRYIWLKEEKIERTTKHHKEELCELIRNEKRLDTKSIIDSNSLSYFFCRRCKTHDCSLHGVGVDLTPKVVPYDGSRKDSMAESDQREIEQYCEWAGTSKCWFNGSEAQRVRNAQTASRSVNYTQVKNSECFDSSVNLVSFNEDEEQGQCIEIPSSSGCIIEKDEGALAMLKLLREVFGDDYCRLAEGINSVGIYQVSCNEVGKYISTHFEEVNSAASVRPRNQPPPKRKLQLSAAEDRLVKDHGWRKDYTPCHCDGPCTKKTCPCAKEGLLCEKYCRCPTPRVNGDRMHDCTWCENAFPGCSCTNGCLSEQNCGCKATRRECDPDLCSCTSCWDPKKHSADELKCNNSGLRYNRISRIVCGHSAVHGWGAFASAPIPQGALIGQYTGEVIKDEDAERRGRVYDEMQSSFLFRITLEYDVDSTRLGNKLRYINHSSDANCTAAIMRVDGDAIIGIYAKKDIQAFEELLFDYGYEPDSVSTSKNSKKAKKRRTNPVAYKSGPVKSNTNRHKPRLDYIEDDQSGMDDECEDSRDADFVPSQT